jgi:hypothetical protein
MKGWMIELKVNTNNIVESLEIIGFPVFFLLIGVLLSFAVSRCTGQSSNIPNAIENSEDWGGYCPFKIYTVFNKHTGVYYGVTETGSMTPLYTIEGEVMLVDQGNEYVVHKNLGEPDDASKQ